MKGRERYRRDMEAIRKLEQQETIDKITRENIEQAREIERLKQLLSETKAT